MISNTSFPSIESHLPEMMDFVCYLAQEYQSGKIDSWQLMSEKVRIFFTPDRMEEIEGVAPGWRTMYSYADGITLIHVMSVMAALPLCPEFQKATTTQQALMKWVVLFHDISKEVHQGQRDPTHGFRSAARTGASLPQLGFAVTDDYAMLIEDWITLTNTAITKQKKTALDIQDNRKLPKIIEVIEKMFGRHAPAARLVKTVLFHLSITVLEDWPQAAPLTKTEERRYLDSEQLAMLKIMMLVDNDSWTLFDLPTKERHRRDTLGVFGELERNIAV